MLLGTILFIQKWLVKGVWKVTCRSLHWQSFRGFLKSYIQKIFQNLLEIVRWEIDLSGQFSDLKSSVSIVNFEKVNAGWENSVFEGGARLVSKK